MLKQRAIDEIKDRLKTAVDAGDENAEAKLLVELGNAYAYNSNFALSNTMYRQALATARQMTDKPLEVIALVNLGLSFKLRTDYISAYSYYEKAIKIAREAGNQDLKQSILDHIEELSNMIDIEKLSQE